MKKWKKSRPSIPEVNERAEGVANWFQTVGNLDLDAPMEFPEGRYSIKCTIEEIGESQEALEIVTEAIRLAMNMKLEKDKGMWDMIKTMTLERVGQMAGSLMPDGFMESLNAKLIEIEKVN